MSEQAKVSTYQQKKDVRKHELRMDNSSFIEWGAKRGYTENQIRMTTRRESPAKFGITRQIAEELGLIEDASHA